MHYYPEMGEKPAERLFQSRHVHGGFYSLRWHPDNHAAALAALKRLRIRPRDVRLARVGIELYATAKHDTWSCLVTGAAHDKVLAGDLVAHEVLLD